MSRRLTAFVFLCCIPVAGAFGEFPPAVNIAFETMAGKGYSPTALTSSQILEIEGVTKSERLERSGVELYEVNRQIPGMTDMMMPGPGSTSGFGDRTGVAEYFEVVSMDVDGETMRFARVVPTEEIERRKLGAMRREFADGLDAHSDSLIDIGEVLSDRSPVLGLLGSIGLAPDTLSVGQAELTQDACAAMGRGQRTQQGGEIRAVGAEDSWLSPDPLTFLTGPACMSRYTAAVLRARDLTEEQKKDEITRAREEAARRIELASREEVDGRPTYKLEMNDLNVSQTMEDGTQIDFHNAAVWIDEEFFVRRKMRMEGVMHAEGESREFFLESLDQDYRNVPGSQLYEPYRTVMRTGGMITPEQQREMQTALAELEDYERQLASMPASQRAMVERMMGDKIDQARSLATGGAVEFVMLTTSIVINPDFGAAPSLLDGGPDLVRNIQQGLTSLGYDPGPVTGEMNQQTAVAIVRFESDQGMEVTGQATPAVAAAIRSANR